LFTCGLNRFFFFFFFQYDSNLGEKSPKFKITPSYCRSRPVWIKILVPRAVARTSQAVNCILFTHLVVRGRALILYGFESQATAALQHPTRRGRVGPKVALSVLSTMTLDLSNALSSVMNLIY